MAMSGHKALINSCNADSGGGRASAVAATEYGSALSCGSAQGGCRRLDCTRLDSRAFRMLMTAPGSQTRRLDQHMEGTRLAVNLHGHSTAAVAPSST